MLALDRKETSKHEQIQKMKNVPSNSLTSSVNYYFLSTQTEFMTNRVT